MGGDGKSMKGCGCHMEGEDIYYGECDVVRGQIYDGGVGVRWGERANL